MSDDEMKALLAELRGDLMKQMNDNHEAVLNRLSGIEGKVDNLETKLETTRSYIFNVPKVMVEALEEGFLQRIARIEADVRKLKGDGA
jgi:hypothetical protein